MDAPRAQLAVIKGKDKGDRWFLDPGEYYAVGRAPENGIALDDQTISKRHAFVECVDGIWFIRDLGSKHGTWVNDEEVTDRRALFHRDIIRLGKTYLVVGIMTEGKTHDDQPDSELESEPG